VDQVFDVCEFEALAKPRMSAMAYAYVAGAAADEITLAENCACWQRIKLNSRVLVDVSQIDPAISIFGKQLRFPLLLAPAAYHRLYHPEGELAVARAVDQMGIGLIISSYASEAIEDVTSACKAMVWFQLYAQNEREATQDMIQRAESAGCSALCLTVDTPILGMRSREARAGFRLPAELQLPNLSNRNRQHLPAPGVIYSSMLNPRLTWDDVEWICSKTHLPVVLKGILNPEDAARAAQTGASALIVSNHGGRNLDTLPSTAEALPRIAEKVNGKLPLLVDGGIRRGTDILKALAMGASAALIGRPYLYALAFAGSAGVTRLLEILHSEFLAAMALTGRRFVQEVDQSVLWQ
jgi:4-hydroxymandelate oxidase